MFCLFVNPVTNLVITFPEGYQFYDEFSFAFTASDGCVLIVPDQVKWIETADIHSGNYYEVSIVNDVAVISKGVVINE